MVDACEERIYGEGMGKGRQPRDLRSANDERRMMGDEGGCNGRKGDKNEWGDWIESEREREGKKV